MPREIRRLYNLIAALAIALLLLALANIAQTEPSKTECFLLTGWSSTAVQRGGYTDVTKYNVTICPIYK